MSSEEIKIIFESTYFIFIIFNFHMTTVESVEASYFENLADRNKGFPLSIFLNKSRLT